MSIGEQIETIVNSMTDNNYPPQLVTIKEAYNDLRCDVETEDGTILRRLLCSNIATKDKQGLLIYLDGDQNQPFVLVFTESGDIDLHDYYTKTEVDAKLKVITDNIPDVSDYYTITQINGILSSYATIGYLNSNFARLVHTHSQYITRDELHNLDMDLTTLELVDYADNPNGVICFEEARSKGYYTKTETDALLNGKQDKLVSGSNIKTINNQSLLGSGNITIQGGGGSVIGTGSFSIDSNGHLIVELPDGVDNPYYIDANGHLIYDTSV